LCCPFHLSSDATLGPNVLHEFDMNKSHGVKQQKQHDSITPESNLTAEHCGKVQKMTTDDGIAKGLQQALKEQGFDVLRTNMDMAYPVT
jgi:hypothetical protein